MGELRLDIPARRPAEPGAVDTRPAATKAWVAALPLGNTGESTRQIYQTLRQVNGLSMPLKHRLELLENLGEPVSLVTDALSRHFVDKPFPMPAKARKVAELARELQREMALGYLVVREEYAGLSWLQRRQLPSPAVVSARLIHYLGGILCNHRLRHVAYPDGVWERIHRLYAEAEKEGFAGRNVPAVGGGETSVLREYKIALMLALTSSHQLRAVQVRELYATLPFWVRRARVVEAFPGAKDAAAFAFRLDSDTPPATTTRQQALLESAGAALRVLDLSDVIGEITRQLAGAGGAKVTLEGETTIGRETLEILARLWGGPQERRSQRVPDASRTAVRLVAGVSGLHSQLVGRAREAASAEQGPAAAGFSLEGMEDITLEADVWNPGYAAGGGATAGSWVDDFAPTVVAEAHRGEVVNYSGSGYCLALHPEGDWKLKVGDLLGIDHPDSSEWEAGYVQWIQDPQQGDITIGVHLIAVAAVPAELSVVTQQGVSRPQPCLLGRCEQDELLLLAPYIAALESKVVQLAYRGTEVRLDLRENLSDSSTFYAYRFGALPVTSRPWRGEPGDEVEAELRELARGAEPRGSSGRGNGAAAAAGEEYADLWAQL